LTLPDELELEFEKVICTDLLLWGSKHLFYIIFCDLNFCVPALTAEYCRYDQLYSSKLKLVKSCIQ
jgi:hypothetical protein